MLIGDYSEYLVVGFLRNQGMFLASRTGFSAWGVETAQQAGPSLTGCQRAKHFGCFSDKAHLIFHVDISPLAIDARQYRRKSAFDD